MSQNSVFQECLVKVPCCSESLASAKRKSVKSVSEECGRRVSSRNLTTVHRKSVSEELSNCEKGVFNECLMNGPHNSVLQECLSGLSHKSAPQLGLRRASQKSALQHFTTVSYQSVSKGVCSRVPYNIFRQECGTEVSSEGGPQGYSRWVPCERA